MFSRLISTLAVRGSRNSLVLTVAPPLQYCILLDSVPVTTAAPRSIFLVVGAFVWLPIYVYHEQTYTGWVGRQRNSTTTPHFVQARKMPGNRRCRRRQGKRRECLQFELKSAPAGTHNFPRAFLFRERVWFIPHNVLICLRVWIRDSAEILFLYPRIGKFSNGKHKKNSI